MEIVKSTLPQSLNVNNKRDSYVKPPIPPKPKIIPKPRYIHNLKSVHSETVKLITVDESICKNVEVVKREECLENGSNRESRDLESLSEESKLRLSCAEEVISESAINDSETVEACNECCPKDDCGDNESEKNNSGYSSTSDSDLRNDIPAEILDKNESNGSDDLSSRLMENVLEDCAPLSSKSSSDSSISYGDSDSDEFLTPKDLALLSQSLSPSTDKNVRNYDTSSSDNSLSSVHLDRPNNEKDVNHMRNKKAFLVAKEIKTSEESYVATLKLLNVEFKQFLFDKGCVSPSSKGNDKPRSDSIPESQLEEIFKFLPNLQSLNEEILSDFKRRIKGWSETQKIADIIVRKGPFLKIYANYIRELEAHTNYLNECAHRYSAFGECLKEFENSDFGRHIPVSKHMLTPMQRITKYKELMKQYLKYLDKDHVDYQDAVEALSIVEGVAEHANEAIRELENSARLLCLQERLNGISNADGASTGGSWSGNLHYLLVEPGRKLLKEGQLMKLCRRGIRVVYLILLSDTLLYTTEELHGGKNCPLKLRYKLPLEGMRVDIPVSEDFQSEFTVISTSRSFTVRARSTRERDEWLSSLRAAIESNAHRRYSFEKAKTADFEYLSLNALGKQAPAWIPDNRVTMCQLCTSEFSLTFRRHHCRACGKVVCRHCSANRAPLEYLEYQTERVCDNCYEELQKAIKNLEEKEDQIDDESEKEKLKKRLRMVRGKFKKGIRGDRRNRSKKPERLLEVCGGDHESQICGYLRHFSRRGWRQSWFVLKDKVLYEYRAPEDVCAFTSLPILGYKVNTDCNGLDIFDGMDSANAFQLLHSNQPPLIYYAESNDLADRWRTVMEKEVDL